MTGPPDDAYGRVTNPERYLVVQDAARDLIDEISRRFDVRVSVGEDVDPVLRQRAGAVIVGPMVRVVPSNEGGAVTFAFTSFPAVLVRSGEWRIGAYPHCGCDACDQAPADAIAQLRRDVEALAGGGVSERWDGNRLHTAVMHPDGSGSSGWTLIERDLDDYGVPREYAWQAWPPASPDTGRGSD